MATHFDNMPLTRELMVVWFSRAQEMARGSEKGMGKEGGWGVAVESSWVGSGRVGK